MNTDSVILSRLKNRDRETLTQLIEDNADVLMRAAWGVGWQGTEAEDIVQDTFASFLDALDRFEGRSSVRTYLWAFST